MLAVVQKRGCTRNYHSLCASGLYIYGEPVNSDADLPQVSAYNCIVQ